MSDEMSTEEWIAHVDARRHNDLALAGGIWHGYTRDPADEGPMRGRLVLVRCALPTVAVSHDDPDEAIRLARVVEYALTR